MTLDEAFRIARDSTADPIDRWEARKMLSESEQKSKREREHRLDTTPRDDWSAWNAWCDSRIDTKLSEQRQFVFDVVGEALGQALAAERKDVKRELSLEIRQLRIELTEAQNIIAELRRVLAADRRAPVDLPALPRSQLN